MTRRKAITPDDRQRGLARRILMLMVLLTLLLALGANLAYNALLQLKLAPLQARLNDKVEQISSTLNRELGDIRNLMQLLRNAADLDRLLQPDRPLDQQRLAQALSRFATVNPWLSQVRWLDAAGQEQARVNVINGQPEAAPAHALQNKAQRYYVRAAMDTPADQVYISPLDLNVEQGQIVRPFQPTLRAAIRTGDDDGLKPGLLVINFNLAGLMQQFRTLNDSDTEVGIVNGAGYWRLHPDMTREWGLELGHPGATLARESPRTWHQLQQHPLAGSHLVSDGRLWSYTRFREVDADRSDTLFILAATHAGTLAAYKRQLLWTVVLGSLLLFAITASLLIRMLMIDTQRKRLSVQLRREKGALEASYSELQQTHHNLQLLQDELVETRKLSSLGVMVAGVAHELNTPTGSALITLSSLQRQTEQLVERIERGLTRQALDDHVAQTRHGLELATHSLRRAASLINSFKRLAVERATEELQTFALHTLVADLLLSLHHRLKHSPVRLHVDIARDIQLHSYPGVLSQLLQNLIENALDHGVDAQHGGNIWLTAQRLERPNRLALSVRDDGRGIDSSVRDGLFDPFITSARAQGHIGLGMHLVHQWATQVLHGRIQVHSEVDKGTQFTVTIPLSVVDPASGHPT